MSREQFRDTFEFMDDRSQARGRFGEAARDNEATKSDLIDLDLFYCGQTPLAISVKKQDAVGPWIWLPKSQIEFDLKGPGQVRVTLPEWLAKEKGLV